MSIKVSSMTELPYPAQDTDVFYAIRSGVSYMATLTGILQGYLKVVPGFEGYIVIPATGNVDGTQVQQDDIIIGKGAFKGGNMIMAVANQDDPTLDTHFDYYLNNAVIP